MQVFENPRGKGGLIKAWVDGVQFEDVAQEQVFQLSEMPFIHKHVAVMPDVHWGVGSTIGSVFGTAGAVIPAAVGVDIGCGMMAVKTSLRAEDLPDNLLGLRLELEKAIPHGRTDNGGPNDRGAWRDTPPSYLANYVETANPNRPSLADRLKKIVEKHPEINKRGQADRAINHLGTLGGGNHFVEVCLDTNDDVWIMLHSGSRGIGNRIGTYFIDLAKKDMKKWFVNLPDSNLAYFPQGTQYYGDYLEAMHWAQDFALENRRNMMKAALGALSRAVPKAFVTLDQAVESHHNYANFERHFGQEVLLTRKGAVSLADGRLGIIPGSMGKKSHIVRAKEGKALADAYCSCSHGAGRSMSRAEAVRQFTVEDHIAATEGVECRKDKDVIDETPMAYKDIDAVMEAQNDHVEIVYTLKQVVCVKG